MSLNKAAHLYKQLSVYKRKKLFFNNFNYYKYISKIFWYNCSSKVTSSVLTNIDRPFQDKKIDLTSENSGPDEKDSSIKHMKYSLLFLGISSAIFGSYVIFYFGAPEVDEKGEVIPDDYTPMPLWKQYILRGIKQLEKFAVLIQEPSREKLLPDPLAYPYYQPTYTLILEFTDVLAHPEWQYQTGWRFKKRPGVDYLLENLVGLYEIVVFTAEPGMTIFPVIEALDQKSLISYKLVRDSTHFVDGHHVKNLDRLNRDLSKVIVVDWNTQSVKFHPDNHFVIDRWNGNDEDKILIELTDFLKTIAETNITDVREVVQFYKQFDKPLDTFKQKQIEYYESQQKSEKPRVQPKESFLKLWNLLL
ncbi:mitochondrial import inner membrane translocase subunit TIM50-C-like [Sitophilus oryzae]|uniref:Mitochondrial import inner membrane translocase subunit TIM50 n=1 Tax=Sitophilus oryzae TaxID=7048 RepID=A0A6J2YH84_SITOR|nr:mitochondrial import inner membrane translocase subunit TIM50-C-like [Sitophilus oryzae]